MKVIVEIGSGSFYLSKTLDLVACPHTGDEIVCDEEGSMSVTAATVFIGSKDVRVHCPRECQDSETYDELLAAGWRP